MSKLEVEMVLENPKVDAIFGLHISAGVDMGTILYGPKVIMTASQSFEIHVKGEQHHSSTPRSSVDPNMTYVKIIDGLQTLISRESERTKEAAVLFIGNIQSGVRSNIIPKEALSVKSFLVSLSD